ncbi:MAG TPA: protein kinase [Solimonas sp.]|nr:protein kinase [Solimonas sp.]
MSEGAGCPPELWPQFSLLLDELLELEPSARGHWLDHLDTDAADLRPYLRAAIEADGAIQAAGAEGRPHIVGNSDGYMFEAGHCIGPYSLTAPLGHGGMGEVWRATRIDGSLAREVALKLPHTWLLTAGMRLRLARERNILGELTHPNIAQIYDAGIAADGQPWLALELIDGLRIDDYCRERRLSLDERLALFAQVMEAVQAAHARLIVHRDIKPANILVTADGKVKLLDFGIAKLLSDTARKGDNPPTLGSSRAATPDYAAPEQLAGGAITVATDVYALGVTLFEVLTGRRPFPRSNGNAPPPRDLAPLASAQLRGEHAAHTAGLSTRELSRALSGDLDAILAKALAPGPAARYASAARMADDLMRHRYHLPIEARHITSLERAGKFAQRHRLAMIASIAVLVSILAGTSASLWQARRAIAAAQRAEATSALLIGVFTASDRLTADGRQPGTMTAREMLDSVVDRLDTELRDQPEAQLELLASAHHIYRQWYERQRVEQVQKKYRELLGRLHGEADPRIVISLIEQAAMYRDYPDETPAAALLREAQQLIRRHGLGGTLVDAQWQVEMAREEFPEAGGSLRALQRLRKAMAIYRKLSPQEQDLRWPRYYYASALLQSGDYDEARKASLEGIAHEKSEPAATRNDWLVAMHLVQLGHIERARGDAATARAAYDNGAALSLATFGRDVTTYFEATLWCATLQAWRGDTATARLLFEKERASFPPRLPADEEGGAWFYLAYARFLLEQGEAAAALPLLEQAERVRISSHPALFRHADILLTKGEVLEALGRYPAAQAALQAARHDYLQLADQSAVRGLETRERWIRFQLDRGATTGMEDELRMILKLADKRRLLVSAEASMDLARIAHARGQRQESQELVRQSLLQLAEVRAVQGPAPARRLQLQAERLAGP